MSEVGSVEFSRAPDDYRPDPDGHFRRRLRERPIPSTAIRKCIESGEAELQGTNPTRIALTNEYLKREYTVIVNPNKGYAVTVFEGRPGENNGH